MHSFIKMLNIYTGSSLITIIITQFVEMISQVCISVSKNLQTCCRQTQTLLYPISLSVPPTVPVFVCPSLPCPSLSCTSSTSVLSYAVLTSASLSLSASPCGCVCSGGAVVGLGGLVSVLSFLWLWHSTEAAALQRVSSWLGRV